LNDRLDSTSVRGMAFVNFHKDIMTVQDIAMIRVVMDEGIWHEFTPDGPVQDSKYRFRCLWAHKARHESENKQSAERQQRKTNRRQRVNVPCTAAAPATLAPIEKGERKERPMFAQTVKMVALT